MNEPNGETERVRAMGLAIEEARLKAEEEDDAETWKALRDLITECLAEFCDETTQSRRYFAAK